jgi:hypothetical protein
MCVPDLSGRHILLAPASDLRAWLDGKNTLMDDARPLRTITYRRSGTVTSGSEKLNPASPGINCRSNHDKRRPKDQLRQEVFVTIISYGKTP